MNSFVCWFVSDKDRRKVQAMIYEDQMHYRGQPTMSNTRRGLPITSSRIEKIFPKLTPAQIDRITADGHIRSVQSGEVLIEQGYTSVPFFVVITGEVEIVRPFGAYETLVTVHGSGEFTGEVNMLSVG